MKLVFGIGTVLLGAGLVTAEPVVRQQFQIPDGLRKASANPDLVQRRQKYLQLHVMRPYQVAFQNLPFNPVTLKGTSVDLRTQISDYGIPVKDQGTRGTCSVFALNFLDEYTACRKAGRKRPNFSEEYLNFIGNLASGVFTDGGFFS